jgi:Mrp family chromosome partitioning ATPase
MPTITREQVLDALRNIVDPDLHRDIVSLGFVKEVAVCDGAVKAVIELTTPACPVKDQMKAEAERLIAQLPGVSAVHVEMTAQVRGRSLDPEDILPEVKHVIAIASGKGGVGKSTVSVNLAVALAQSGARVGLLDADIYGPSIPKMMGCQGEHPLVESGQIIPIRRYGVSIMSIGFLLEEVRRLNAPILGVVENMAEFVCPSCGARTAIFPGPGARAFAEKLRVPFLGSVPLDPAVSVASDAGQPAVIAAPDSAQAQAFREIAGKLAAQVSVVSMAG